MATSETFNYTGDIQTFTAPSTGTYKLEVWGAQGGGAGGGSGSGSHTANGGLGGYSKGYTTLTEGDILYVCVGNSGTENWGYGGSGGYNGGGNGSVYVDSDKDRHGAGGGGGATHIATVTGTLSTIGSSNLDKILIIAGGGGGAGYGRTGGIGGGTSGGDAYWSGGTQTTGYAFGSGQSGSGNAGGGGGGLYGGHSGTNNTTTQGGAGGGSGYIEGLSYAETTAGLNSGAGKAVITFIEGTSVNIIFNPSNAEGDFTGQGEYPDGVPVTIQYSDTTGKWKFIQWNKDGQLFSTDNPYTFTLNGNTDIQCLVDEYGKCILM